MAYNRQRLVNNPTTLLAWSRQPSWTTIVPRLAFTGASIRGKATSTKLEAHSDKRPGGRPPKRRIHTLDSSRLEPSDFQDISSQNFVHWSLTVDGESSGLSLSTFYARCAIQRVKRGNHPSKVKNPVVPFPEGTRGFLYYLPPGSEGLTTDRDDTGRNSDIELSPFESIKRDPDAVGRVLFRITDNNDPSSFAAGRDLMQPGGITPWYAVPRKNSAAWRLLIRDGLLIDSNKPWGTRRLTTSTISALEEPFLFDLSNTEINVYVRSKRDGGFYKLAFGNPFCIHQKYRPRILRCQFERSAAPKHAGTDTFVIRVLEISAPVRRLPIESDTASFSTYHLRVLETPSRPEVGELLPLTRKGTLWSRRVSSGEKKESKWKKGWHVLLDNEMLKATSSLSEA
ncbi:uncharacterized protein STEHIDRAFT_159972 [Stereum hirsutum FP-91666 SS1]|uniref:uncharacterized protein n=1 Tax=Stereum hirsutum (strain FP-91666) TaxID=721885 RepID=UPI000444962E|nr:uncharacterized protein STEHIDRAFT_159972 [Stereum hirsutum FP-91666 SS1]EIM83392.1 hypothetical protein STEHIDRAFT_159972 [Stereum hirsutum FP-91666 SS1]